MRAPARAADSARNEHALVDVHREELGHADQRERERDRVVVAHREDRPRVPREVRAHVLGPPQRRGRVHVELRVLLVARWPRAAQLREASYERRIGRGGGQGRSPRGPLGHADQPPERVANVRVVVGAGRRPAAAPSRQEGVRRGADRVGRRVGGSEERGQVLRVVRGAHGAGGGCIARARKCAGGHALERTGEPPGPIGATHHITLRSR
ncbi:MAG: hypothetical protein M5U28_17755 [Sandaracinaceae bacterium]|nr:hypothetical protein [Sandaracinaceae bacterium]